MKAAAYKAQLIQSRTQDAKILLAAKEYRYRRHWRGMLRTLPPPPQPAAQEHLIVLDLHNGAPLLRQVLSSTSDKATLTSQDVNNVVLVYLSKDPVIFRLTATPNEYQLADGCVTAELDIEIKVTDARTFWESGDDPLRLIEAHIEARARAYFRTIACADFIATKVAPRDGVIDFTPPLCFDKVIAGLKSALCQVCINGVTIRELTVQITFPKSKAWIDLLLTNDYTFFPYHLGHVIETLDGDLTNNFYTDEYDVALRKVEAELAQTRQGYQSNTASDVKTLRYYYEIVEHFRLPEFIRESLRQAIHSRICMSSEVIGGQGFGANHRFIKILRDHVDRISSIR
jgi:hypothetical protein